MLESTGDFENARDHFERALAVDEAVYGENHPLLVFRLNALGRVLAASGERAAASRHFARATALCGTQRSMHGTHAVG